jgi:hypothetical protein
MLSHCANFQCSKPFLRLREGKLFLVETQCGTMPESLPGAAAALRKPPRRVEHFWLCDRCASVWTLIQNGTQGIALVPLTQPSLTNRRTTSEGQGKAVLGA